MANPFHTWYPLFLSSRIKAGHVYASRLLNEPLVVFRDHNNQVSVLQDRCPHRSTPLSLGQVRDGRIECPYHGWQFDGRGQCRHIPALLPDRQIPPLACARCKPVCEKLGLIWVYMGPESDPAWETAYDYHLSWESPKALRFENSIEVNVPHQLMVENLLDPSHLPFAHDGTISRRSRAAPIAVTTEQTTSGLKGHVSTYYPNGEMRHQVFFFDAPVSVFFDLHFRRFSIRQVHYCVPLTPERMRLISVFYYWNLAWLRWIPGMQAWQRRQARKIVSQDRAMLEGQNWNLGQKAKAWNQAVQADRLALAYRQWFDRHMSAGTWFDSFAEA